MKFKYIRLNAKRYKFFYENGEKYGEFYLELDKDTGTGEIFAKDQEYAQELTKAFSEAMEAIS